MPSDALNEWSTHRADRIEELFAAHAQLIGRGRALRAQQLNWALTMRLGAEFQGFARGLHNLAVDEISRSIAELKPVLGPIVRTTMKTGRRLDRGNPTPAALDRDFDLIGIDLWLEIDATFPGRASVAKRDLQTLLEARNAIAHSDERKLASVEARGHPLSDVRTVRDWHGQISELCSMMDVCVSVHVSRVTGGGQPW